MGRGQRYPTSSEIDVREVLASEKTVRDTITSMASNLQTKVKYDEISKVMKVGGGINLVGVNIEETGQKSYDFRLHDFPIDSEDPISKKLAKNCAEECIR